MRKGTYLGLILAVLLMGMISQATGLGAFLTYSEGNYSNQTGYDLSVERKSFFNLYDPVELIQSAELNPPLQVRDENFPIAKGNPNFKCFFKEDSASVKFVVKKAWITYEFVDSHFGGLLPTQAEVKSRSVDFSHIFTGMDVRYTVDDDSLLEEIILSEPQEIYELVQKIQFEGVEPHEQLDGSILFWNGETYLFGIPSPVMYELSDSGDRNYGLHYELELYENDYYLRKIIDEEGMKWLMDPDREYPVVIDATTESFEDAWESSGLTPYGQYFENLSEYVSPVTGGLTVKQTDFYLPGRGLDVAITRVYTTPAVFSTGCKGACTEDGYVLLPTYEDGPYKIECPPVDIGNGWQLNFPWVGYDYIHYVDGTMYPKSSNHTGHHFTFADGILTNNGGTEYTFTSGRPASITDVDGNTITFQYFNGRLISITDTLGRVITFSYNERGQVTQIAYGSYTVQYAYVWEALVSVTDPLGRVTSYEYDPDNNWIINKINYPTGGYSAYAYSYFSMEAPEPDYENCAEYRKYHVWSKALYSPDLVRFTTYSLEGDFDEVTGATVTDYNEQSIQKASHHFTINSDQLITQHTISHGSTELRRIDYTYSDRKEVIQEDVYVEGVYAYTKKYLYDSWGNLVYEEDADGRKTYSTYANTDYSGVFVGWDSIPQFSNTFPDSTIQSSVHTAILGSVRIQDSRVIETYCHYDTKGHMTDTYQVFKDMADYATHTDTMAEPGTTSFSIDLTGVSLEGDAVLKVTGIPTANPQTKTETHSVQKPYTWFNEGYWQQNKFYAKYFDRASHDYGYEPVGPFIHYPGTAGYQSYSTWVSGLTQYVKTVYTESEDKYPVQVEYHINGNDWKVISSNLQDDTVYLNIPVEELISGQNILYLQESSSYTTSCEWSLFVPHAVAVIEETSSSFTYDAYGNLLSLTDALGNTISFGYDTQYHCHRTSITNALNDSMTADYDYTRGFLTSITDLKGNTTSYEYDILGRITKKINPDLSEKEAVYDDQNNTTTLYDELNQKTMQYYDGLGRVIKEEKYLTPTIKLTQTYTYTYQSKVKTITDPGGDVYSCEYDVLGRTIKHFYPDGTFSEVQYQDSSYNIVLYDENRHKKENQYSWSGNLLWVREYINSTEYYQTDYTYDLLGHLMSFTDAKGNTTLYEFDSIFGCTQVTYPDATFEQYSYDALGNLIEKTDVSGTTLFSYDDVYQAISIEYPDQSLITYEYDENENCISMIDPEGQITLTYDGRNRMISETRTIDNEPYTVSYVYDATSKITGMVYPDQTSISYAYDALNRVTSIPGFAEFDYNPEGLLSSMTYGNGVVTAYSYDDNDRPLSIHAHTDGTDLLMMAYQYDAANNITQLDYDRLKDGQWTESTETYSYDWLDRLVSIQGSSGSVSYSYDPAGNRTTQNDLTYTYNDMNELLTISDGTSFTYDQLGNTLTKTDEDSWSYTYDVQNQLTQVEKNQQIIALYDYDGNGRRVKESEWSEDLQDYKTTICMYSGLDIIYEKDADSGEEAIYVYSPRGRIAESVDGLQDYYHIDFLGSTRLVTDENGAVTSETQYKAFGENESEEKSHLYTGKEKDSSELYYFGSRYYDSEIGRFITRDNRFGRKSIPQSFNRYIYCLNNPLKYVDPDGKENASWLFDQEEEDKKVLQYSQAPQLIEYIYIEYDYTPFIWYCIAVMIVTAGCLLIAAPEILAMAKIWWGGLPPTIREILIAIILMLIAEGITYLSRYLSEDGRFEKYEFDTGYIIVDKEVGEIIKGERYHNNIHQVWVHVPGEGEFGGHWEDDRDNDGVASSVDDDDDDPTIGDEDPNIP